MPARLKPDQTFLTAYSFGPGVAHVMASARLMSLRSHYLYKSDPERFAQAEKAILDELKSYESHPDYRSAEPYGA